MNRGGLPSALDVYAARRRLRPYLSPTPLLRSGWLSAETGADVHLKIESLQVGRSFKIRGAVNAALELRETEPEARTIVTASAGNHGQAMAVAAGRLGLRAVVCVPRTAPETKKAAIRRYGAELRDEHDDYDAAEAAARRIAADEGAPYISPYNHPAVIAGAGTIGLELIEALPRLEVVVVPLGGGGLASGIALALDAVANHVAVVGVEVDASTPFSTGIARGAITPIRVGSSLADGMVGNLEPGAITFALVRRHVHRIVTVCEDNLARAIRGLAADEHLIAEGAGAAATAAVLARQAVAPGRHAVVLLTGGNIDLAVLAPLLA